MATTRTTVTTKLIASQIEVCDLKAQLAAAIAALTAVATATATPVAPKRNPDLRDYTIPRYTDCSFSRPVKAVFTDLDEAFEYRAWLSEQGRGHPVAVRKCSAPAGYTIGAVY